MPRKKPRAVTSTQHHFDPIQILTPLGEGAVTPLKVQGFRPVYLPFGSLCLIERLNPGGSPCRILVLDHYVSPFLRAREFRRLQQRFREVTKAGRAIRWIAFYPGRRSPQYIFLSIPSHMAAKKWFSFFGGGRKPGRPRSANYKAVYKYQRDHPKLSHQGIARRLKLPRSTVSRILGTVDLGTEEDLSE
jgi:hypothetical protein